MSSIKKPGKKFKASPIKTQYRTSSTKKRKHRVRAIPEEERDQMTVLFIKHVPCALRDLFKKKCERERVSMTEKIIRMIQEDIISDEEFVMEDL